jgi:hypothetical protein
MTEVSPEVVWEGAGTRFPHPRDVLMAYVILLKLVKNKEVLASNGGGKIGKKTFFLYL